MGRPVGTGGRCGQDTGCGSYPGGGVHRDTVFDQHVCHWNVAFLCDQMEGSESTLGRKRSSSAGSQDKSSRSPWESTEVWESNLAL